MWGEGEIEAHMWLCSQAWLVNYTLLQRIVGRHPPPTGDYVAFSWAEVVVSTWCLCYLCNTQIMLVSHLGLCLVLAFIIHVISTVWACASAQPSSMCGTLHFCLYYVFTDCIEVTIFSLRRDTAKTHYSMLNTCRCEALTSCASVQKQYLVPFSQK